MQVGEQLTDSEQRVWVKVRQRSGELRRRWGDRGVLSFERGRLLITFPQGEYTPVRQYIKIKAVVRKDPLTLTVNSGFWSFGWLTLTFDFEEDSTKVELELLKMLS